MSWFDYLNRITQMPEVGVSWHRASTRSAGGRDIRDDGLHLPLGGIHKTTSALQPVTSRERPR